jgi:hypothetical protein
MSSGVIGFVMAVAPSLPDFCSREATGGPAGSAG